MKKILADAFIEKFQPKSRTAYAIIFKIYLSLSLIEVFIEFFILIILSKLKILTKSRGLGMVHTSKNTLLVDIFT